MPGSSRRCKRSWGGNCPRFSNVGRRRLEASTARASTLRSLSTKASISERFCLKAASLGVMRDVKTAIDQGLSAKHEGSGAPAAHQNSRSRLTLLRNAQTGNACATPRLKALPTLPDERNPIAFLRSRREIKRERRCAFNDFRGLDRWQTISTDKKRPQNSGQSSHKNGATNGRKQRR